MGVSTILFKFDFALVALSNELEQNLALRHIKEFVHVTKGLATLASTLMSSEMVNMLLTLLSSNRNSPYLDYLLDFQQYSNLELILNFFRLAFLCMFHLWVGCLSTMVFKHF
jgi:hypothetical protein